MNPGIKIFPKILQITWCFPTIDVLSPLETSRGLEWAAPGGCRAQTLDSCISSVPALAAGAASPRLPGQWGPQSPWPRAPSGAAKATCECPGQEHSQCHLSGHLQQDLCREARYSMMPKPAICAPASSQSHSIDWSRAVTSIELLGVSHCAWS